MLSLRTRPIDGCVAFLAIGFLCLAAPVAAQVRNAKELRSLSLTEEEDGPPVHLTGVVTFSDPPSTVFIQDETAGTFFRLDSRTSPQPGDEVEVRGRAFPGLYLPGIEDAEFTVLSHSGVLDPIPVSYDDLMSGRFHYQRVVVEGIVRTVVPEEEAGSLARIAMGSRVIEVHVEQPPTGLELVDCRVTVAGLAAGHINARRQLVEPYLRCAGWSEIEILKNAVKEESIPEISSVELLNFTVEGQGGHRVRMSGTVLASFPGGKLFLRDEGSAISVRLRYPDGSIRQGDQLVVIGFPEMSSFSASLADASVAVHENGESLPEPKILPVRDLMNGEADGDLVSIEGELIDLYRTGTGGMLTLQSDGVTLQARTPAFPEELTPGSRVKATGIFQVETTRAYSYRSEPESVSLRLRSLSDLRVLASPSWWTPQKLAIAAITLLVAVALAGLWIGSLRRQVGRQTVALRETIEHEATLEERQRIAREFHDTLEQELAGLSLRLDAAVAHGAQEKLKGLLDGSRKLVSRIQMETRDLVSDLRDTSGAGDDLEAALRELVENQTAGIGPDFSLETEAQFNGASLPPRTVHHLKMIAREAIANAMKHSGAQKIELRAGLGEDDVKVEIADDGTGFDATERTRGMPGHFGCMGIRERCEKIGATVEWVSNPDKGTTVCVRLPMEKPEK